MNMEDYGMRKRLEDGAHLPESVRWEIVRHARKLMLADSDWTQLPDAEIDPQQRQAWQAYRKKLRDLPKDFARPEDVVLPDPPDQTEAAH
jgi:hypothetical protein